jgi:hypothetical protein
VQLALLAGALGPLVRDPSAVENGLPWVMDMVFRDAERRLSKDRAPVKVGTTTSSQASSRSDPFARFPWLEKTG